ncbi:hypothetical protein LTR10_005695 [Elasticomyces elasticus]|nr:hypothetical protein LTR10_005695 [Elasticomyces elasticus]KAK4976433.1 hypothetical protein LTR42_004062 [Elasticomyces elasticus]
MAFTTASNIPWTRVKALSFDIFGTLVDWEGGIDDSMRATALGPYLPKDRQQRMLDIERHDTAIQRDNQTMLQRDIIAEGLRRYAAELKIVDNGHLTQDQVEEACKQYGGRIGSYPAFPDTIDAINRLGKHYKLIPLTNVDNQSFDDTLSGPLSGCRKSFSAVYTAEDIGSYKPSQKNFDYLLDHLKSDFGIEKGDLVHVAQSLFHDHGPATKNQLMSVWVDRGGDMGGEIEGAQEKFGFQMRVQTLGELAEIVDAAFGST